MKKTFLIKNGFTKFFIKPIKADASFRKYYRVTHKKKNFILVSSPKNKENNNGYLRISRLFNQIGLSVPKVFDYDKKNGLFLIEDFGSNTFSKYLSSGMGEEKLYNLAIENLIYLQKKSNPFIKQVPQYTNKMFLDEIRLFLLWYWPAIFKKKPSKNIIKSFEKIWKDLLLKNLNTKKVLVHRDFHIDNLFFLKNRKNFKSCGLIDFQDTVIGPSSYDLVSLLEDARRDVNDKVVCKMYDKFIKQFNASNKEIFKKEYIVLAANRHIKVIGIFTRLFFRDGKKQYLKHIPRIWRLLEKNLLSNNLYSLKLWLDNYFPKKYRKKPKI